MSKVEMLKSIRRIPGTHISEERRLYLLERIQLGDIIHGVHSFDRASRTHTWSIVIRGVTRSLRALAS